MENFVIVFLALLFFAVSIGAVDNYSNYNKTEKSGRDINSVKIKKKSINKSTLKYKNTVIQLQELKIISQKNILKTQEANLSKCLRKQNSTSLQDEFNTELERASQQNICRTQELILTDCRSKANSQKATIDELNQKIEQREYQIQNLSKLQQNQEHELTFRRNTIESLANENKQKNVYIHQLKNDLDYEKLKYAELLNEFTNDTKQLSKQLEDAELKNQKLMIQYEEKVDKLQNEKIAREKCENYFDILEIEHGKLKRLVKDLETNNTGLDSKYNQQTTENKNLISSKTELSDKLTACVTTLKQKSAVIPCDKLSCPAFGNYSATHVVNIENGQSFKIPCNSDESNLVWSVIERRLDQSLDLDRRWTEYREGFGDFKKEFFIGLEKLHLMTKQQPHQLLIRLRLRGEMKFAKYSHFEIAGEDENYAIRSLGKYSGDAGDGMRESEGKSFSTFDRDNDLHFKSNCAQVSRGGWWFDDCGTTNLNYQHLMKLVRWNNYMGSLTPIEMLIRPT